MCKALTYGCARSPTHEAYASRVYTAGPSLFVIDDAESCFRRVFAAPCVCCVSAGMVDYWITQLFHYHGCGPARL